MEMWSSSDDETLYLGESDPEDDGMTWDIRRDIPAEKFLWNQSTGNPIGPQNYPEKGALSGLSKWAPLGRRNTKRMQRRQGVYVSGDMGGSYIKYIIDSIKVVGKMTYFHMVYPKNDYHMLIRSTIAGDFVGLVHLTLEDGALCIKVVNAMNRDWVMWLGKLDCPENVQVRHVSFKTHRFLVLLLGIPFVSSPKCEGIYMVFFCIYVYKYFSLSSMYIKSPSSEHVAKGDSWTNAWPVLGTRSNWSLPRAMQSWRMDHCWPSMGSSSPHAPQTHKPSEVFISYRVFFIPIKLHADL